jgi:hypothetical protein
MKHRRRSADIATLTALVVAGVLWIHQLRLFTSLLLVLGVGVILGLLLHRRNSRKNIEQEVLESRQGAVPPCVRSQSLQANDVKARLRTIDWFQFEKVIAALYRNLGYAVTRRGGAKPDGGIDLVLENGDSRVAVQCKHWRTWKIREGTVRDFFGALAHAKIEKGIIVTLCGPTRDALRFAAVHSIEILDEAALNQLFMAGKAATDPEILAALNDDRKFCPKCEAEMVHRTARKGRNPGSQFWGCSTYPRCNYTLPIHQNAA